MTKKQSNPGPPSIAYRPKPPPAPPEKNCVATKKYELRCGEHEFRVSFNVLKNMFLNQGHKYRLYAYYKGDTEIPSGERKIQRFEGGFALVYLQKENKFVDFLADDFKYFIFRPLKGKERQKFAA